MSDILNNLSEEEIAAYSATPTTEPHIVVGADRKITVPDELKRIAVQHDHNMETVTFDCPRYWDGHDMSAMVIYINYMTPDGGIGTTLAKNVRIDETDDTIMHFEWTISRHATVTMGYLSFLVCVKNTDDTERVINHWNSELNRDLYISEGLEVDPDDIAEEYPDIITQILLRLGVAEKSISTKMSFKGDYIHGRLFGWNSKIGDVYRLVTVPSDAYEYNPSTGINAINADSSDDTARYIDITDCSYTLYQYAEKAGTGLSCIVDYSNTGKAYYARVGILGSTGVQIECLGNYDEVYKLLSRTSDTTIKIFEIQEAGDGGILDIDPLPVYGDVVVWDGTSYVTIGSKGSESSGGGGFRKIGFTEDCDYIATETDGYSAFASAVADAVDGETFYVMPGTYVSTETLTIAKNLNFVGIGMPTIEFPIYIYGEGEYEFGGGIITPIVTYTTNWSGIHFTNTFSGFQAQNYMSPLAYSAVNSENCIFEGLRNMFVGKHFRSRLIFECAEVYDSISLGSGFEPAEGCSFESCDLIFRNPFASFIKAKNCNIFFETSGSRYTECSYIFENCNVYNYGGNVLANGQYVETFIVTNCSIFGTKFFSEATESGNHLFSGTTL